MADKWIHARMDEDEHAEYERMAKNEKRSLSQMIRILLAEAAAVRKGVE
jgi:hypothetical protein